MLDASIWIYSRFLIAAVLLLVLLLGGLVTMVWQRFSGPSRAPADPPSTQVVARDPSPKAHSYPRHWPVEFPLTPKRVA